jgi:hypothetical protein
LSAKGTRGHSQIKHVPQPSCPAPSRRSSVDLTSIYTLLARRWHDCPAPLTVRCQTPGIAHKMDARQGDDCCQLLQDLQRRQCETGCTVRPRFCERVNEISVGIFLKTLKRHSTSCRVPNQALSLVTPMRRHMGVGVERKPAQTGTAGSRPCGAFPAGAQVQRFIGSHFGLEQERHRVGSETHNPPRKDPHIQNAYRRNAQHRHRGGGKTR